MSDRLEFSRRDLLAKLAAGASIVAAADAQHVHESVAAAEDRAEGPPYKPKALTAHEYATLQRLSDLIIPADEHSPGALAAAAADFIDFLCNASEEMRDIYTGGILWLDEAMKDRYSGSGSSRPTPEQQTAMLDLIAWRKNAVAGAESRDPVLRLLPPDGRRRLLLEPDRLQGGRLRGQRRHVEFSVPKEAVEYALKRSGLG